MPLEKVSNPMKKNMYYSSMALLLVAIAALSARLVTKENEAQSKRKGSQHAIIPAIPVLCYHQTYAGSRTFGGFNVEPDAFEKQIKTFQEKGYRTVSLQDFENAIQGRASADFPEKPLLLTFDDGLTSNAEVVLPILKKYGMTGVLFIYPEIIKSKKKNYMRWPELKKLAASGVFEIGSHTLYHPKLPFLSVSELRRQLQESKATLEKELGQAITALAYPFGLYNQAVIDMARSIGYRMAFTINPGPNEPGADPFRLQRFMVMTEHSLERVLHELQTIAPAKVVFQPADGAWIHPGQEISVQAPGHKSAQLSLGGRKIKLEKSSEGSWHGQLPDYTSKTGLLYLTFYGANAAGQRTQRQILYLDQARHKKKRG